MNTLSTRLIQRGSPFELQDAVINGIQCKVFPRGPQTLQDVFMKTASFGQSEFIVSDKARLSFRQALEQANVFSRYLQEYYGVTKGSRVALLMPNCPEWAVAFIAIYLAGATAVIIYADAATQAVLTSLDIATCALIVTDREHAGKLEAVRPAYPVVVIRNARFSEPLLAEICDGKASANSDVFVLSEVMGDENALRLDKIPRPAPDDEALIAFTSGSTGAPKGVVLSHRNMTTGLMNMMLGGFLMSSRAAKMRTGIQPAISNLPPCSLLLSALSHIGGYAHVLLMCYLGGKIVLMPRWDMHHAAILIESEKVRSLNGASSAMIRELLRSNHSEHNLESLTNLNIHGSALLPSFISEIASKFPYISLGAGYGMTETCGSVCNISGMELLNNPDASGQILPSVDIKVIDDAEQEVLQGQLGEICIRGAMVMRGYCGKSNNTAAVIKDGWLRTGDMGRLDSDGQLYVTDRLDDVILCGPHRISAGKLERAACEHHMVDEAIVLGVPDAQCCESIVLTVLPRDPIQFDENELKSQLSLSMANLPVVPKIIFYKSLPRTVSGKINRNELRRQVMSEL